LNSKIAKYNGQVVTHILAFQKSDPSTNLLDIFQKTRNS
jgi:hypothetical protein